MKSGMPIISEVKIAASFAGLIDGRFVGSSLGVVLMEDLSMSLSSKSDDDRVVIG